jgi:hypothetical protein
VLWTDRQQTRDVSKATVAVTNDKETLSVPFARANAGNNVAALPSLSRRASPVFAPHFYQRPPHPPSHLLKELPVLDGTDVSLVCYVLTFICLRTTSLSYDVAHRTVRS